MLMVGIGALIALFGLIGTIAVWPEVNKLDNADIGEGLGLDINAINSWNALSGPLTVMALGFVVVALIRSHRREIMVEAASKHDTLDHWIRVVGITIRELRQRFVVTRRRRGRRFCRLRGRRCWG